MPQPRREPMHPLTIKVPRRLFDALRLLALDPERGKARHGAWTRIATEAFTAYLKEQQVRKPE